MIIAEHPKSKPFPSHIKTKRQKTEYLCDGVVTVGKFSVLRKKDFFDFYLPRIKGFNFQYKKKKTGGAKTAEQAFRYGVYLKNKFIKEARNTSERPVHQPTAPICNAGHST